MSECDGSKTLGKEGATVSGSIFLEHVTRGYGLRLRTSREEDEMTISNTRTVRSGRFLTAPSIRWSRLYMSTHSYAGYAVTFHCILINTWLNQARTTLLITQDKKTRQNLLIGWKGTSRDEGGQYEQKVWSSSLTRLLLERLDVLCVLSALQNLGQLLEFFLRQVSVVYEHRAFMYVWCWIKLKEVGCNMNKLLYATDYSLHKCDKRRWKTQWHCPLLECL